MKTLSFVKSNRGITEHEFDLAEAKLGVALPADYRLFLLAHNGGLPSECIFDIPGRGESSVVFYGIGVGDVHDDLLSACSAYARRLPDNAIPVGFDPGGNQICLVKMHDEGWAVFFWDHETDGGPLERLKMWWLADSFSEFIDFLRFEDNQAW